MAIYLDREGVESCISTISSAIETLRDAAASIDSAFMNNLGESWQGNAYEKAMSTYQEGYQNMLTKTVPEMVTQLNDFISTCEKAIVEVDNQLSGS